MKLIMLVFLVFISCTESIVVANRQQPFTLIKCKYKIIDNGYFSFIVSGNKAELVEYSYNINPKSNKAYVSLYKKSILTNEEFRNLKDYKTSLEWAKAQKDSYREKYFKVLHDKFLLMSNEDRILLLDSLANIRK